MGLRLRRPTIEVIKIDPEKKEVIHNTSGKFVKFLKILVFISFMFTGLVLYNLGNVSAGTDLFIVAVIFLLANKIDQLNMRFSKCQ